MDKICVSLGEMPFEGCLLCAERYPMVEMRLDLLRLTPEQIAQAASRLRSWVATCREGRYDADSRAALLTAALHAGATYIDLEYEAPQSFRAPLTALARQTGAAVIISYHNFDATPPTDELHSIIRNARAMQADYVKIAVMAHSTAEVARVMALYEEHPRLIAFAMGTVGKISRIAAPLLGAPFTYAALDAATATAPGQLTVDEAQQVYALMRD